MDNLINPQLLAMLPVWLCHTMRFALVKYGGGIIQMSGSIAGNTHARNRYGNYMRARTKPVNPNTFMQSKARSALSFCCDRWSNTLTAGQRTAWNLYAANVAMKNKLGETINLTGFNHYVRSNSIRKFLQVAIIDAGPTVFELPPRDPIITIDCDSSPQKITVGFDVNLDWATESGAHLHLRQGVPQNPQRNFFAGPWQHVGTILGNPGGLTTGVAFTPVKVMTTGQHQWCAFRILRADGRMSEIFTASAFVHAQAIGEVPMLLGLTEAAAVALLTAETCQLVLGAVTTAYSDTVAVDLIISSDPVAHTRLNAGDAVNIVVSLGPEA